MKGKGWNPNHTMPTGKIALPKTNIALKIVVSNRNLLFQWSIFRGYVSFREGNHEHNHQNLTILFFHCNSKSGMASIHYHLPSHLTILFATYPCFTTVVPRPSLQICFSTQHRRQPGCGMDCITNLQNSSKKYQLSPEN